MTVLGDILHIVTFCHVVNVLDQALTLRSCSHGIAKFECKFISFSFEETIVGFEDNILIDFLCFSVP